MTPEKSGAGNSEGGRWGGKWVLLSGVVRCSQRVRKCTVLDTGDTDKLRCVCDTQGGMRGSIG